jgi:hypothetical protein
MPDAYAMVRKTDAPELACRPSARSMEQASQTPSCSVSVPSDPRRQRKTTMNAHRLVAGQARDHRWKPCLQLATPDNTQIYEDIRFCHPPHDGQDDGYGRGLVCGLDGDHADDGSAIPGGAQEACSTRAWPTRGTVSVSAFLRSHA